MPRPRKKRFIADKVYEYFKDNAGNAVSIDEVRANLELKYNTAMETIHRLYKEGFLIKIRKGVYAFKRRKENAKTRV